MMLEAVAADVAHELLQLGDMGHRPVAEGVQRVVRQLALADVGANARPACRPWSSGQR